MTPTHYYEIALDWQADRKGILSSTALNDTIEVATPPEFPQGMARIWSPEHLFVATINSCFMTTFLAIAENSSLEFVHFHSKAVGKLEQVNGKYMISEVTLFPIVTILHDFDATKVERILKKSEDNCLVSNSVRSKISVKPEIKIGSEAMTQKVLHV
jgi:peroxiredoxin-like protein